MNCETKDIQSFSTFFNDYLHEDRENVQTCNSWNLRPLLIAGFVAFVLQHVVGKSFVDISSELIDLIDVVSFVWPFRIFKFDGFCRTFDGSLPKSHLPFHIFSCGFFSLSRTSDTNEYSPLFFDLSYLLFNFSFTSSVSFLLEFCSISSLVFFVLFPLFIDDFQLM